MSAPSWSDLISSPCYFEALSGDRKDRANDASSHYVAQLAMGVSGLGNLLSCTATNGETGISAGAVADVASMMIAIGDLIVTLNDINTATAHRNHRKADLHRIGDASNG